eukprot:920925-Alexandrium_andersonii.AAC.1
MDRRAFRCGYHGQRNPRERELPIPPAPSGQGERGGPNLEVVSAGSSGEQDREPNGCLCTAWQRIPAKKRGA